MDADAHLQETDAAAAAHWKGRCHTLEASLEKFRLQTLRIRVALGDQMRALEERAIAADDKAKDSEIQV
ncbi:hypothetical protein Ahia01_001127100, partial [Argonauta hians]